jgi:hypothetical protein
VLSVVALAMTRPNDASVDVTAAGVPVGPEAAT